MTERETPPLPPTRPATDDRAPARSRERLPASLLGGAVACVWYALPDYVTSPRDRALVKTVLLVPAGLYGAWLGRDVRATAAGAGELADDAERAGPADAPGTPSRDTPLLRLPPPAQVALGLGALVVLATGTVAAERGTYRFGEQLARGGVSRPHTRIGLALGALTVLTDLAGERASRAGAT
ncbi:hypothetical protein [Cellulomonas fimi]|uniref:Uncharacterized protein n=1 Tax=Cellulomonas fimi TaxID=1708 RepID=A0A7Y0QH10_CELFI|nr:hypothetical protein [Cellulomonas fimi]NMR18692.1 hypothetical protein [Cellulomonas fimi]